MDWRVLSETVNLSMDTALVNTAGVHKSSLYNLISLLYILEAKYHRNRRRKKEKIGRQCHQNSEI